MQPELIACKNCGNRFLGKYCNECGQKVYTEHDRSTVHFLEEGVHFLTHFEGTFFTTLRTMFRRPGQVSVDYTFGIRKRYFRLLSLFMLLVVLYLLFPYFEGLNQKLKYHKQGVYGRFATNKVEALKHAKHWDDAQVEQAFHHASEKTSKFLLVVLIPLTALAFWAVSWRRRKYSFDQMVFATEVNCMYLIWGFLLLPLLFYIAEWICVQLTGSGFELGDAITSLVFLLLPMTVFVWVGAQRFYGYGIGKAGLFALYFAFVHTFLVMIAYKFILFVVVINQIH